MTDRGTGAPCAEQDDRAQVGRGQSGPQCSAETAHVGVVADQPTVSDQDRIDGADGGRGVRDVIEVGQHLLLARMGHIAGVVAEIASLVEQHSDVTTPADRCRQVDRTVEVAQALVVGLALVHRRRQGRDDTLSDEADQERLPDGAR